jgi:hypothetical protein
MATQPNARNCIKRRFVGAKANKHRIFAANFRRMFLHVRRLGRVAIFLNLFVRRRLSEFEADMRGTTDMVSRAHE